MEPGSTRGKVPFGLKDGRLWYVNQVETGLACGCVCPDPACAKPLIARNKPSPTRKRIYHFRHASLTTGCGGRESALHRMGKEIVQRASRLQLPAWSAGKLSFDSVQATLAPGSAVEVSLSDGQMRPDVRVFALVAQAYLPALYIEVKVSHAVDCEKRERVIAQGYSMIEIDLSEVSDELLEDEHAFTTHVLDEAANRRWVHVGNPLFLAKMANEPIYQITNDLAHEKRVPTKKGGQLILHAQTCMLFSPSEDEPTPREIELADTISHGQRVDALGNALPYRRGLYAKAWVNGRGMSDHYKTHLQPVVQDTPENQQAALKLG